MTLVASSLVSAVCVFSGCGLAPEDKPTPCETDESQCPVSSRLATDVACECKCVAGFAGITPTRAFEGEISTCLPPSLNVNIVPPDQKDSLEALTDAEFNQRVYKFCSQNVAGFLDDLVGQQQSPRDLSAMCVGPRIKCECSTSGAHQQTAACSTSCVDQVCDASNCLPLFKVGGLVDATGCACSRVNMCGSLTPPSSDPPLCMNRLAGILRRANRKRTSRDIRRTRGSARPRARAPQRSATP